MSQASRQRPLMLAFGGLIALAAAMGIGRFLYTPILPAMVAGLGLTKGEAGLIAAANFLGYLLGALATMSARLAGPPRAWLIGALMASAASTAAMGLVETLWAFLALRFAGGVASALVLVFASSLVLERLAAAGHSGLAAVHFAGVGTGIAASALTAAGAAALGLDWHALWLIGGALSLGAVGCVLALVPADTERPVAAVPSRWPISAPLQRLTLAYGLFGFGYVITATFLVAIVRAAPDGRTVEPWVWLAVGVAAIPSVALWSAAGRRIGALSAFALAALAEAAGVALSVLWPGPQGALAAAVLLGGTFMGLTALGLMAARQMAGAAGRQAVGGLTAAFGLGQIVGPLVAGWGHDLTGSFQIPTLIATAALVLAAGLASSAGPGRTKP